MLLHDRKVYTEALNAVLQVTEFADAAEHVTPPDEIKSGSKSAGVVGRIQAQLIASKLHPGQCSSCSLFRKHVHASYNNMQRNIGDTMGKTAQQDVLNPNLHPHWLPKPSKASTKCNIQSCKHPVYSRTNYTLSGSRKCLIRGLQHLMSSQGRAYQSGCAWIITCRCTVPGT